MAYIIETGSGRYHRVASGITAEVTPDGSLIINDSQGLPMAVYSPNAWACAVLEGQHSIVDALAKPE